jgi:regulator of sirC expression with transglutaminase-like and TPR domain
MHDPDRYSAFRQAVDRPDERIDLCQAALAIATREYPDLNIEEWLRRVDQIAHAVELRLGAERNHYRILTAINTVLFKDMGYRGNRDDYYDPRNSYLNEVIERRRGIPITLSVLYMEVARRVGLSLHGVGFPGHFLVKYDDGEEQIIIDAFNGGEVLTQEDLEKLLQQLSGGKAGFDPVYLGAISKRQILQRMLNNLKNIYLQTDQQLKSLAIVEQLLIVDPRSAADIRDRGLLYVKLECFIQAAEDLEKYLTIAPAADDAPAIKAQLETIKRHSIQIH